MAPSCSPPASRQHSGSTARCRLRGASTAAAMPPSPSSRPPACKAGHVQRNKHHCILNIPPRALQRGECSTHAAAKPQQQADSSSRSRRQACPPATTNTQLAPCDSCWCWPMPAKTGNILLTKCAVFDRQRARQAGSPVCPRRSALCSPPHLLRSIALHCSSVAAPRVSKHVPPLTWRCCPYLCPNGRQCSLHQLPPPQACHMHTRPAQQGARNSTDVITHSRKQLGALLAALLQEAGQLHHNAQQRCQPPQRADQSDVAQPHAAAAHLPSHSISGRHAHVDDITRGRPHPVPLQSCSTGGKQAVTATVLVGCLLGRRGIVALVLHYIAQAAAHPVSSATHGQHRAVCPRLAAAECPQQQRSSSSDRSCGKGQALQNPKQWHSLNRPSIMPSGEAAMHKRAPQLKPYLPAMLSCTSCRSSRCAAELQPATSFQGPEQQEDGRGASIAECSTAAGGIASTSDCPSSASEKIRGHSTAARHRVSRQPSEPRCTSWLPRIVQHQPALPWQPIRASSWHSELRRACCVLAGAAAGSSSAVVGTQACGRYRCLLIATA